MRRPPAEAGGPPRDGAAITGSLALVIIVIIAVGARLLLISASHATEEDFFITLRYAVNLAAGRGLVYNPGEAVLGTTTPLYTLILALLIRIHIDPVLGGKLLNVGADALVCLGIWRLGRAIGRPGTGVAGALCFAVAPTNLIWSPKGMEVDLVAATVVWAWTFYAEGREVAAWIAVGLLTLFRIDGALAALILLLAHLFTRRRFPGRGLLAFVVVTLPWLAFSVARFGSPVPTSVRAKMVVYGWMWRHGPAFPNLAPFALDMTHNPLGAALAVGCLAGLCVIGGAVIRQLRQSEGGSRPREDLLAPAAIWMVCYYGAMALSKVFLFGWYFVPPTPIYYLIASVGWWAMLDRVGFDGAALLNRTSLGGNLEIGPAVLVTLAAAAGLAAIGPRTLADLRSAQAAEKSLRIPIGLWLRRNAKQNETVMLEPIGYIGYLSGMRVLDTVGLVSPEVLQYYRADDDDPYHALWTRFRPDWMLLRTQELADLNRDEARLPASQRFGWNYREAHAWYSLPSRPGAPAAFTLFRLAEGPKLSERPHGRSPDS